MASRTLTKNKPKTKSGRQTHGGTNTLFHTAFAAVVQLALMLAVFLTPTSSEAKMATLGLVVFQALIFALQKDRRSAFVLTSVFFSGILLFFFIIYANIDSTARIVAALAVLMLTGFSVHKITGIESFYGFLMVRSLAGFDLMKSVATHHPRFSTEAADFGASMTFGIPWAYKTYGSRKAMGHLVVLLLLMGVFLGANLLSSLSGVMQNGEIIFALVGVLAGFIGLGVLGMAVHAFTILTVPNTPAGVRLLIPFVTVPGEALFAIAVIAIVHETAHGVLCYVEKLKLKSSGVLLFGFLPVGAFVEPDEEKLDAMSLPAKRRILVAGSASNTLFFLVFLALSVPLALILPGMVAGVSVQSVPANSTAFGFLQAGAILASINGQTVNNTKDLFAANLSNNADAIFLQDGKTIRRNLMEVVVQNVDKDHPASGVLLPDERIVAVEGISIKVPSDISEAIRDKKAGESVRIQTQTANKTILLGSDGKLGIQIALSSIAELNNQPKAGQEQAYAVLSFVLVIFSWTFLLNILIGIVNLLPLFITDGQKMIYYELVPRFGKDKAAKLSTAAGIGMLLLVLLNALPYFLGKG
ncbi:site-2 protease family protein [Candidatus Micrarchaeota archaeon]|nr:site-2 protease family protein [Candidatus Micrarchaeota archaeon]